MVKALSEGEWYKERKTKSRKPLSANVDDSASVVATEASEASEAKPLPNFW
jgi:hypothetical protein